MNVKTLCSDIQTRTINAVADGAAAVLGNKVTAAGIHETLTPELDRRDPAMSPSYRYTDRYTIHRYYPVEFAASQRLLKLLHCDRSILL